nr:MAG: hypothetical protein [Picobirnavirus sp.]
MTRNVLEYLGVRETVRSNQAKEEETRRSNLAKEAETRRYNEAALAEQQRHNLAAESQAARELAEKYRSNRANEAIGFQNAASNAQNARTNTYTSEVRQEELDWKKQYDTDTLAQTIWRDQAADIRAGDANAIKLTEAQTGQRKLDVDLEKEDRRGIWKTIGDAGSTLLKWILK